MALFLILLASGAIATAPAPSVPPAVVAPAGEGAWVGPIKLCRDSVVSAARTKDEISGGDLLLVTLTEDGRARLAALTRQSVGLPLIIRIDGQTVSEPIVMEPIDSGQFQFNVMNVSMMKRWQARLEGNC